MAQIMGKQLALLLVCFVLFAICLFTVNLPIYQSVPILACVAVLAILLASLAPKDSNDGK